VGKLIQKRDSDKSIRNEIYHALITCEARCEITRFLVEHSIEADELISIQTDGVRITKSLPLPSTNGLGAWRCNGDYPTIVVSPRKVYCQDKKPYRVSYSDLIAMTNDHPQSERYARKVDRHITLSQAKSMGDIYRVGEYAVVPARFDLMGLIKEQCRQFPRLPKTGRQLFENTYHSTPILIGGEQ